MSELTSDPRRVGKASVAREPWLWIVLLTTVVHVVRGNVADVCVFSGTAVAMVVDARRHDVRRVSVFDRLPRGSAPVACVAYAAVVLPLGRTDWPLHAAIAVPGVVAATAVLTVGRSPLEEPEAVEPVRRRWLLWPGVLVVGCLFELANFIAQPNPQTDSYAHPTLSALVDPMLDHNLARAVFAGVWLGIGWWLVRTVTNGREVTR